MTVAARPLGRAECVIYMALPMLLSIALSARLPARVLDGDLINPDSYMRMTRLVESLHTNSLLHTISRDSSGAGTVIHWSHLLDSVLLILAAPAMLLTDHETALRIAALMFGPLNLAVLGLAVAWAAAPFAERSWLWLAPFMICPSPEIVLYGLPGVVHHHVASVTIAVMAGGWVARIIIGAAPGRTGLAVGAWAGLGIWLTPETLPLSIMAFGALWLAWVWHRGSADLARAIADAGISLALSVTAAWIVDPPAGGYAGEDIDRVSIVFVSLAYAIAGTGLIIRTLDELTNSPSARLWWSVAGGLTCATIWALLFAHTLFGGSPANEHAAVGTMFEDIAEMAPIRTVAQWLNHLLTGCLAVVALLALGTRTRAWTLLYAGLCGAMLIAIAQRHIRFACYPEALGAIMLPIIITALAHIVRSWPAWRQPLPRLATIILFVLAPLLTELSQSSRTARAESGTANTGCPTIGLGPMLTPYAGDIILTDVNKVPELLYRTRILTVGSLYHRNPTAFMRLRAAWRTTESGTIPPEITAAGVAYVLFCGTLGRSDLVKDLPKTTLLDRLARGEPPAWLALVADDRASGHTLYRVKP